MEDLGLRPIKVFIRNDEPEAFALMDLQNHLLQFNRKYSRHWSLTLPKRGQLGTVVGKASDANHNLYQEHVDLILQKCPRPITVDSIRQVLVDSGEKPTTSALLSPAYFKLITHVLNPETKLHRKALVSLAEWGTP